jgi:uncharacterized protein
MKLDVKNLTLAPFGQKESFSIELFNEKVDEEILAERTKGSLTLTRLEDEILAEFKGQVKAKITCDRCLAEFEVENSLNFKQEYALEGENTDEKMAVAKDLTIDIQEPIRQEIIVSIPMKKLCSADCKGICSGCGKNLNVAKCKCKRVKK